VPFFTESGQDAAWQMLLVHLPLAGITQSVFAAQPLPTLHFAEQVLPQSTSVSVPFFVVSVQVGDWQIPLVHTWLWQSALPPHFLVAGQAGHEPPQSTSVSVPFLTLSAQLWAWHTPEAEHELDAQSAPVLHACPVVHFVEQEPPQSVSVSLPFFTPSPHAAPWQTLPVHLPLAGRTQSALPLQPLPTPHLPGQEPPQSVSVSLPFFARSVQLAVWQTPAVHTALAQSPLPPQSLPAAHFVEQEPPQSASLSEPFLTPSVQAAPWHDPLVHLPLAGSAQSPFEEQPLPTVHWVAHEPPQSRSVSEPFLTPSGHDADAHTPFEQRPLAGTTQSPFPPQVLPTPHLFGQADPQSTSASEPLRTVSVQLGAWQTLPVHTLLPQSVPAPQPWPGTHLFGQPDPQSTSDSVPFFTVSVHVGAWQTPPVHTLPPQSLPEVQCWPDAHFVVHEPPQSVSLSLPFFVLSLHVGP
jgi:hypothetical protein